MNQRTHRESVGRSGLEGTADQHSLCLVSGVTGGPDRRGWQQRRPGRADFGFTDGRISGFKAGVTNQFFKGPIFCAVGMTRGRLHYHTIRPGGVVNVSHFTEALVHGPLDLLGSLVCAQDACSVIHPFFKNEF